MKRALAIVMLAYALASTPWAMFWATPRQLALVIAFDSKLALAFAATGNLWQAQQMEDGS